MKFLISLFLFFSCFYALGQYGQGQKFDLASLPQPDVINGKFKIQKALDKKFNLWVFGDLKNFEGNIVLQDLKDLQGSFPKVQVVLYDVGAPAPNQYNFIKNWIALYQPNFPVAFDKDSLMFKTLELTQSPNLFVFNPKGRSLGTLHSEEIKTMLHPYFKTYLDSSVTKFSSKRVFKPKNGFQNESPHFRDISVYQDSLLVISAESINQLYFKNIKDGSIQKQQVVFAPYAIGVGERGLLVSSIKNHNIYQATRSFTKIIGDDKREPYRVLEKDANSPLNFPTEIFCDGNSIYVSTSGAHQIWDFTSNGLLGNSYAGNALYAPFFKDGFRYEAGIRYPLDIIKENKNIYFIDRGLNLVRKISEGYLSTPGFNFELNLQAPSSLAIFGNQLFVVDRIEKQIKMVNLKSKQASLFFDFSDKLKPWEFPISITKKGNKLFVLIDRNEKIWEIDAISKEVRVF